MFVHIILSLLLLIAVFPIVCLTILGTTPSSHEETGVTIMGIVTLLCFASIPWWLTLSTLNISGLWIAWGAVVGATIGALTPTWSLFINDSRKIRQQGYTRGLFGMRQNARDTLRWDCAMISITLIAFGFVTVPLGLLVGLSACWLAR